MLPAVHVINDSLKCLSHYTPDDCFSPQMDSPESGDTDDVSSENDNLRTNTQKQKVRPKQLPFPASLLERKSDDVIVSDINVSGKLSFSFQFRN